MTLRGLLRAAGRLPTLPSDVSARDTRRFGDLAPGKGLEPAYHQLSFVEGGEAGTGVFVVRSCHPQPAREILARDGDGWTHGMMLMTH